MVANARAVDWPVSSKCQKGWNIADINLPASDSKPAIVMPPLSPPEECLPLMETRADDTEPVIRKRLEVTPPSSL